jgi:CRP/FNR family transcriptional regulator, cyclic AMP receptor protein
MLRPVAARPPEARPVAADPADAPLVALFTGGRRQSFRPGTELVHEGDASNRVILILAGRVKVWTVTDDGVETVLGFRGPGEILGELAALDGEAHVATVTAMQDGEALVIPASRFLAAVREDPDVADALLRRLVRRLREADRRRAEFVAKDVTGRVAQRLVELAAMTGIPGDDGIRIGMPISQRELAAWAGASREAVNKSVAILEAEGLVVAARRSIVVRDLEALCRRAG